MKYFQQLILFLFALMGFAAAQGYDSKSYDTTIYRTSTVYRTNVVHKTRVANATSASATLAPSVGTVLPYASKNATVPVVTGTLSASAPAATFTGAASQLNVNAFVAVLAAGVGYLAL